LFWKVFVVTILVNPCLYFNLNWLPTYFVQTHGMKVEDTKWILTAIYIGLDLGYLACGASTLWLVHRGFSVGAARRSVFLSATFLMTGSAAIPWLSDLRAIVGLLTVVNFAIGIWITTYLTMASEVSSQHVSTAAGLLGGSGSLFGALAMWAVGTVTQATSSFAVPLISVSVAAWLASLAGIAVSQSLSIPESEVAAFKL
jgi:cyanate permease